VGVGHYRKIAASGARPVSLWRFGVNRAAHHWRAVDLLGMVEVLPLACRSCVVTDPLPRAFRCKVKSEFGGHAELAGGRTSKVPAELPVRQQVASCSLAAPSRELTKRSRLVARARASWRAVAPSGHWRGQIRKSGICASMMEGNRFLTMHSTRLRNRLFAQTKLSCRNGLMRR